MGGFIYIYKNMSAFEDNCFCFQVTGFFYNNKKKSEFLSKIKGAICLIKIPVNEKQKQ